MTKLVVILSIAFAGAAAAGVITHFKMSRAVEELDSTIRQQRADLDTLSETVKQMSQVVRQVIAINSMRNGLRIWRGLNSPSGSHQWAAACSNRCSSAGSELLCSAAVIGLVSGLNSPGPVLGSGDDIVDI
jgi:hypothetical protein